MKREIITILPKLNDCGGDIEKKWFVYYSFRNPKNGTLERIKSYRGLHKVKTKSQRYKAAENIIADLSEKLKHGWNPYTEDIQVIYSDSLKYHAVGQIYGKIRKSNKNFSYYANQFVEKAISGLQEESKKTYISRFRIFNTYLESLGADGNHITEVNNDIIIKFFNYLINEKKLARRTTGKYKQLLNALFEWIIESDELKENPIRKIPKNNRVTDFQPQAITRNDLDVLKVELKKDPQLWLASQFLYYCFLRPRKELRLMKIKDVDLVNGRLRIPASHVKVGKPKSPIIPDEFLKILRNEFKLHTYDKEFYVLSKLGEPGPIHLAINDINRRFNSIRDRLNLPVEYKFYSFKHTGNAALKRKGVSMQSRQKQNGHLSEKSTMIYSDNIEGFDDSELRKVFPTF